MSRSSSRLPSPDGTKIELASRIPADVAKVRMPVKGVVISSGKPNAKPLNVQMPRRREVLQKFFQPLPPWVETRKSQHEILRNFFQSLLAERERGSAVSSSHSKGEGASSAPDDQGLRDAVPEAQEEEGKVVDERGSSESEPWTVPVEQKDDQPTVEQEKQSPGSEDHKIVESRPKTEPEMTGERDSS
ncbi:hypothetical protein JAAARDRAFT_68782 [Jaapia argillacea MUCL 33604]|uniref:Uncharacterized protein n=1 Tax=Jaapia argillacea MUCL 33604 TaxID=933084 RepID=A0A067PX33_9AGAM|nr:hypothetical protein JAAARDRAFT_68782 [Jaapia argillacea MUCL 33604]